MFIAQCLIAVLVASDDATTDAAVVGALPSVIEQVAVAVETLDHACVHTDDFSPSQIGVRSTRMSAAHDLLEDRRPVVTVPSMLGHVRPHPRRDLMVDSPNDLDRHPELRMIAIEWSARP